MEHRGERRGDLDRRDERDGSRYDKRDTVFHAQVTGARNERACDLVI
jgi:hypothetical protein